MVEQKLTPKEIKALQATGWDFLPTGPNEWEWIKFSSDGKRSARQGSDTWEADLQRIKASLVSVEKEVWVPTMQLQWLKPKAHPAAGFCVVLPRLQQKWRRTRGGAGFSASTEWRDISEVSAT